MKHSIEPSGAGGADTQASLFTVAPIATTYAPLPETYVDSVLELDEVSPELKALLEDDDDTCFDDEIDDVPVEAIDSDDDTSDEDADPPVEAKGSVQLRPYQELQVKSALHQFNQGVDSTLIISATGTGKSLPIAMMAKKFEGWKHGNLTLVHRDELIGQLVRSMGRVGTFALREKGKNRALHAFGPYSLSVVASVQTLTGARLREWPRDAFKLIQIDECHRAPSPTYQEILQHFQGYKLIGYTGTADRLDGKNLGTVFQTIAHEYNLRQAIQDEWLVPLEAMRLETDPPVDLRHLNPTKSGDYNVKDLDEIIQNSAGTIALALKRTNALGEARTIGFTPDTTGAKVLAAALNSVGISADWVSGSCRDRAQKIKRHQMGQFQVLLTCELLVEGYDDPEIENLLMCRPTKSRRIYSQCVGRITRRFPEHLPPSHPDAIKKRGRIIDLAYLSHKHDLVSPVDLFDDQSLPDDVLLAAKELVERGVPIEDALVESQLTWEEEQRLANLQIIERDIRLRAGVFDPVGACALFNVSSEAKAAYDWQEIETASPKLINALRKWGIDAPDDIAKDVARRLMNKVTSRHEHGWSSPKQIIGLIKRGYSPEAAAKMRARDAGEIITNSPLPITQNQIWKLKRLGVPEAQSQKFSRRQASELIDQLMSERAAAVA